jgi:hypothetical protein
VVKLGVFCTVSPPYTFARGTGNFGIKTGYFDARVVIRFYTRTAKSSLGLHATLFNTRTVQLEVPDFYRPVAFLAAIHEITCQAATAHNTQQMKLILLSHGQR